MTNVLLPLVIGIAFGAALERAGLGNARKLTGQFYLTDLTVFKVMFTAIVTAMLGLFWLSRLGWIDLDTLRYPETYLRPQIAGGLVFGAGFALAGLCPGTSCVAAASGRGDGVAVVAGLFSGVLLSGFAFPLLLDFYDSDARGAWTLPSLLHVSVWHGGARRGAGRARRFCRRGTPGAARMAMRQARIVLAILALALALAAAIVRTPAPRERAAAKPTLYRPPSGC